MENTLHAKKVTILGRLIKESSLTLEEALMLLEEEPAVKQPSTIPYNDRTNFPSYPSQPGYWGITPTIGTGIIMNGSSTTTTNIKPGDGLTFSYNNAQEALNKLFGEPQTD